MKDMRILHVGKFYPIKGGVEKVMYDLCTGLSSRGIRCDMLCASEDNVSREIIINDYFTVYTCSTLLKFSGAYISLSMIGKLKVICKRYDIIHIHYPDPTANLALRFSGFTGKVIMHFHGDLQKSKVLLAIVKPLNNWVIKRSDLIVGTTPVYVKDSGTLKNVQQKCTYLPIGTEGMGEKDDEKVGIIKSKYPGKKIVFSLGRLVPYKGYEYLIDAARFLPDDYVVLIGSGGPLKNKLIKQIAESHLEEKVYLIGRISDEDLPNYYWACDLYCLSSINKAEAFAIVQIEAMSCGKPIVATKIKGSGVPWVNEDGVSGVNVDPEDSLALAEGIKKVLGQDYLKFSEGSKNRYLAFFTMDRMMERAISIYNAVYNNNIKNIL